MSVFSEKDLVSGLVDCTNIDGYWDVTLSHTKKGFTVKAYEQNKLVYTYNREEYSYAKAVYESTITELATIR
jgi:hypothetical protein